MHYSMCYVIVHDCINACIGETMFRTNAGNALTNAVVNDNYYMNLGIDSYRWFMND